MKTSTFTWITTFLVLFICSASKPPANQIYQYNYENVLGTSFELKVYTNNEETANQAEQIALSEVDRLNSILSTYDSASEISLWLKTYRTEVRVSPELFEVFTLFDKWKDKTNGALSASVAVASNLWKQASLNQKLPDPEVLTQAIDVMKQPQWILNPERQTAVHLSHQKLVLNSFVKSYIIEKISSKVSKHSGVQKTVLNIGGDIVVTGDQQEKIHVTNPISDAENDTPLAVLSLHNKAIATSGSYRRGFQIGREWFSHILDVRTARPVTEIISATIVADNATDAGALATAFNILPVEESAIIAASVPGVEYQIITKEGKEIVSEGWKALEQNESVLNNTFHDSNAKDRYEVSIELELARFEGRFRRPFVAVWVENKKKESVRTITVWYNKPRWLPDLKKWYSKNQTFTQAPTAMSSISSATRSAGKYTLTWDGNDDTGQAVPAGKYTLYIEAAREHGTYQLIKQEIEWNGKPKHFDLEGGIEITSASVDVHAVTGN